MLAGHCCEPVLFRDKDYICQGSSPHHRLRWTVVQGKLVIRRGQDWLGSAGTPSGVSGLSPGGVSAAETLHSRGSRASSRGALGGISSPKPLWEPVSAALAPGMEGKTHCAFQSQDFRNKNEPFNCIFHLGM